ncbi:hypothetical protein QNI19_27145 [Cytophagaceae bacterium DM2B3-1]|uniref:Uncharacterized protein n=1 Tax=Xanthocytophaga flava TaxID=3048013 RepID=A0ABT7CSB9_9BACT|nr:hypothetical protein [Xanthocytophaga flavus]MDJ1471512.1 hypothetical protein [Xanthocytophaga flavus]MDJ1496639.1 hypothetical protein [Xanthocytophaga flavus]
MIKINVKYNGKNYSSEQTGKQILLDAKKIIVDKVKKHAEDTLLEVTTPLHPMIARENGSFEILLEDRVGEIGVAFESHGFSPELTQQIAEALNRKIKQ